MLVGFGESSITPRGGKVAIAGRIPPRLTDQVHDDLQAVAMIVEDGIDRTVWVCCDICHPTAILTNEVAAELEKMLPNFHKGQLIISATHSSACTRLAEDFLTVSELRSTVGMLPFDDARRQVRDGIVNAVMRAKNQVTECIMAFAKADIITGLCRRVVFSNGKAVMYGKTDRDDFVGMEYPDSGPSQVLYFYSEKDNALVGIFAAVPCPAQADESSEYLTGDYWHIVRDRVKKEFGEDVVVVGACASAGELAPRRLYGRCFYPKSGPLRAAELGNQIADSIIAKRYDTLREFCADEMCHKRFTMQLEFPVRQTTKEEVVVAEEYLNNSENFDEAGFPTSQVKYNICKYAKRLWDSGKSTHSVQISAIRIADVLLYATPVELYTAYAKRINAAFPDYPILDVQLSNDNMGYLPTKEAIDHGGYSTFNFNSLTGPDGGEVLVATLKELLGNLIKEG